MGDNPYQTPKSVGTEQVNVKTFVRPPAVSLAVLALLTLLLDISIGFVNFVDAMRFIESYGILSAAPLGLGTVFMILMHLVVLIGAIKMFRLTGYRFAKCAAIVSLVPMCSPGFILGIPFGIWPLVALSKPEVRQAFSVQASSQRGGLN